MPDDVVTSNFVTPRENQGFDKAIPRPKSKTDAETVPQAVVPDPVPVDLGDMHDDDE